MKIRRFFPLFLFLVASNVFSQQNPKAIQALDKARESYERSNGVSAEFSIIIFQKNKVVGNDKGSIKMKGSKFRVSTESAQMWFDGKNQWILPEGTEEVSLSAPSESEMDAINPSSLFQIYNKGFNCKYVAAKTINGKVTDVIDLIPSKTKQDIAKITVNIDQKTSVVALIFVQSKSGNNQKINITNYKSGMNYQDNVFVFNPKQYPKVEVVDVR